MGACVSVCIRLLTRIHDERTLRGDRPELNPDTLGEITPAEKQPSVLLMFSVVERQKNETKIVNFLCKVFKKAPGFVHQRNSNGETLLYFTCKEGKARVVTYLLDWCDPRETCARGSAIHACVHAMHSGSMTSSSGCEFIRVFLERGCDIDAQNSQGCTAFYLAAALGCHPALKLLADRGCDVTAPCFEDMTPLHAAAVNGDLNTVHYMIGLPDVQIDAMDCQKRTPLTVTMMAMLRPSYFTCSWFTKNSGLLEEKKFGARAAIVERLLMAGSDVTLKHKDNQFHAHSTDNHLCNSPISVALCVHDIIKEERSKTYQRSQTFHRPSPECKKLDALNRLYGITVAMVIQLLQYGSEVPHGDLLIYAPPLLRHLEDIMRGQCLQESGRPLSLQKLCRTCLRVHTAMGTQGLNGLGQLPLPTQLIQFLRFYQHPPDDDE